MRVLIAAGGTAGHINPALAIAGEMTLDEIIATIHSHPTVTESIRECALDAMGRAIHVPPRKKKK